MTKNWEKRKARLESGLGSGFTVTRGNTESEYFLESETIIDDNSLTERLRQIVKKTPFTLKQLSDPEEKRRIFRIDKAHVREQAKELTGWMEDGAKKVPKKDTKKIPTNDYPKQEEYSMLVAVAAIYSIEWDDGSFSVRKSLDVGNLILDWNLDRPKGGKELRVHSKFDLTEVFFDGSMPFEEAIEKAKERIEEWRDLKESLQKTEKMFVESGKKVKP
jgi:hypothetical protein